MLRKILITVTILVHFCGNLISRTDSSTVYISRDGIVSIEAEHFSQAGDWKIREYYTGLGISPGDTTSAYSPARYIIELDDPGPYFVHVLGNRRRNTPVEDNAFLLELKDERGFVVSACSGGFLPVNAPIWSSRCHMPPDRRMILDVPEGGRYELNINCHTGRGFYVDKILLSRNPDFRPSGTGPEETCTAGCVTGARREIILPPRWAFGVLYGGYTDQKTTLEVIDSLIHGGFPIDAYWIDSYFWDFDMGKGPGGYIDFRGDTTAFPDTKAMWEAFTDRNVKAGLWIWNLILETGNERVFEDFRNRGYFSSVYRNTNGWHNQTRNTMTGVIDFENPGAVAYWKSRMKPFFDNGLDFLKLDNSSSMPFCRAAFTATQELGRETGGRGFILSHLHSTHAYEHKLYPTKWTGDAMIAWTQPDYPDLYKYAMGGLKENIAMVADPRRSTYEIPFLSHDAGGYDYFGSTDQSDELYMRWIQFSSMNSIMMFFSQSRNPTRNHPYRYPERVQENFRKYTHLRMRLFPYIYSYALKTRLTGEKMIRGDADHENQFLLGDEILVAPVFEKGATTRRVFLPEGSWIDFESQRVYEGNREVVSDAPLEKLPLLIRQGAIIPMRNYARSVELGSNDTLTLEIFPSDELTRFELLEDDGISNGYLEGKFASTAFTVIRQNGRIEFTIRPVEGGYSGMKDDRFYRLHFNHTDHPRKVRLNGKKIRPSKYRFTEDRMIMEISVPVTTGQMITIQL